MAISGSTLTRVFLVDDHDLFRAGVRAELAGEVEIVGEAASVEAAVERIQETSPEVVLLDVHLPDGGGEAVIRALAATLPDTRFLALSVSDAAEDVIAVIRTGARGYVTKSISGADLADAIRRVSHVERAAAPPGHPTSVSIATPRAVRCARHSGISTSRTRKATCPAPVARGAGSATHRHGSARWLSSPLERLEASPPHTA